MASPTTVRNDKLAGNWLEKKWLAKTIPSFFAVSKIALKWRPITPTFYLLAGVELEDVYQMTCGSNIELQNTMHTIYVKHGAVDLQIRGRDEDSRYYLKCTQPGRMDGPAKAIICVSPPQLDKNRAVVAKTESSETVADGKVKCAQAGRKHGPAKAVICVSPPQLDKDSAIVAKTESSKTVADGKVQDREDWVDVVSDVSEEADDWVEV